MYGTGSRRVLDVMDVNTQKALELTVKDWVKYYEDVEQHQHRLLNVISLEFSHTRLEDYVDQPQVVRDSNTSGPEARLDTPICIMLFAL